MKYNRLGWAEWHYTVIAEARNGTARQHKGSYQKCQFLIVTLLAACHMGFVRCPYSNAVLKVWGEAIQRTWTKPPLITENILQSKRRRIVKQVWVGSEAVARLTV